MLLMEQKAPPKQKRLISVEQLIRNTADMAQNKPSWFNNIIEKNNEKLIKGGDLMAVLELIGIQTILIELERRGALIQIQPKAKDVDKSTMGSGAPSS